MSQENFVKQSRSCGFFIIQKTSFLYDKNPSRECITGGNDNDKN